MKSLPVALFADGSEVSMFAACTHCATYTLLSALVLLTRKRKKKFIGNKSGAAQIAIERTTIKYRPDHILNSISMQSANQPFSQNQDMTVTRLKMLLTINRRLTVQGEHERWISIESDGSNDEQFGYTWKRILREEILKLQSLPLWHPLDYYQMASEAEMKSNTKSFNNWNVPTALQANIVLEW